jgi:putative transposase
MMTAAPSRRGLARPTAKGAGEGTVFGVIQDLGDLTERQVRRGVVSGRGIRSHKRLLSKQLGEIAQKRSRCQRGSKRWKRLQRVRCLQSQRAKRRIRDLRHKGTRRAIDFCVEQKVGTLFLGNPRGVRDLKAGRHHNQRISRWEVGKDIDYLCHKAEKASIVCSTGDERGTSSRCPQCGHRHRPRGRNWQCRACGFAGHRDLVGAANMHENAFGVKVTFPASVTYRRAGPMRAARGVKSLAPSSPARRRSPDTGLGRQPQMLGSPLPKGAISGPPRATGLPVRRKTLPAVA